MTAGWRALHDGDPAFIHMNLGNSLDKPMPNFEGGKGTALYHRALDPTTFYTTWSYVDHLVLPPGVTAGPNAKPDMARSLLCDQRRRHRHHRRRNRADPCRRREQRRWASPGLSPPLVPRRCTMIIALA